VVTTHPLRRGLVKTPALMCWRCNEVFIMEPPSGHRLAAIGIGLTVTVMLVALGLTIGVLIGMLW
jgi:hypothetical protein